VNKKFMEGRSLCGLRCRQRFGGILMFRNTLVLAALLIANAARTDDEEVIA
jgi:hypothetical protein